MDQQNTSGIDMRTIEILRVKRQKQVDDAIECRERLVRMTDKQVFARYAVGGYALPPGGTDMRENLLVETYLNGIAIIDRQIARLEIGLSAHPVGSKDAAAIRSEVDTVMERLGVR